MRPLLIVAVSLMLMASTGCRRKEEPPLQAPPGPLPLAQRVQVLNADVLVIDGRHVRLAEAAAPQPIPDARCWAEALAAKQATAAVREMVRSARDIRVAPTGQTDEYNRVVAHVLLDNQDLGRTLHDQGLAAESPGRRFAWCEPISKGGDGAPTVRSLLDLSRG